MKKITYLLIGLIPLVLFITFTVMVRCVDAHYIEDVGYLGFYTLNMNVNEFVRQQDNHLFDVLTDILLFLSLATVLPFAIIGIHQLVKRKSLAKVDPLIYFMLGAYILSVVHYVTFILTSINASPLSTPDEIKQSYPSTHVFIFITYLFVALTGLFRYIKMSKVAKISAICVVSILSIIMVIFRLYSGQHYLTDIIGGVLLAAFNITLPYMLYRLIIKEEQK